MKIKIRMERLISHQTFAPQLNYHVKVLFDAFSNNWTLFQSELTLFKEGLDESLTKGWCQFSTSLLLKFLLVVSHCKQYTF